MGQDSGVGVLDKAMILLDRVATAPSSLNELVEATGLPRATAHRLAVALESHDLLERDDEGRFGLGPRLAALAAARPDPLLTAALPTLRRVRDDCDESAQLYVRSGRERVCVAAAERQHGLRTTVPVGTRLPLTAGSGAQVLLAFSADPGELPSGSRFTARTLADVRRRGFAQSVAEREAGVASVSVPVRDARGELVAALSISGPIERFGRSPGSRFADRLAAAAERMTAAL